MALFLVRHGRLLAGELDPVGFDDVWALRDRLPQGAAWCTAPEPGAVATAQLLTEGEVGIVPGIRDRESGESAASYAERVVGTVTGILAAHAGHDVVLVGHARAWTVAEAALTGTEPDPDRWARLGTPDVVTLSEPLLST